MGMIIVVFALVAWLAGCPRTSVSVWERGSFFGVDVTCSYNDHAISGVLFGEHGW